MLKSNFPFTEKSTRVLAEGITLPRGILLGCLLTPRITAPVNYGWISRIYADRGAGIGCIEVSADTSEPLCTVSFNLRLNGSDVISGVATDSEGNVCGHVTARSAIIPFFYADYSPDKQALILTPSALRILNVEAPKRCHSVQYKGVEISALATDDATGGYEDASTSTDPYISKIVINNKVTLQGNHVSITTDCGGLRVVKAGNELKVGRFCDIYE